MFKEKDKAPDRNFPASATLISAGTVLTGDVKSGTDLRIDGTIHGNVSSAARIVIGPSGHVEGNIEGANADIGGKVTGNITVKELLQLRAQSIVDGNIIAINLQVDPHAVFNGRCQMGASAASIVPMNNSDGQKAEAKQQQQ